MPDGTRHSRNFRTKMDAEAWLATERSMIDRDEWTRPKARKVAEARRECEQASWLGVLRESSRGSDSQGRD